MVLEKKKFWVRSKKCWWRWPSALPDLLPGNSFLSSRLQFALCLWTNKLLTTRFSSKYWFWGGEGWVVLVHPGEWSGLIYEISQAEDLRKISLVQANLLLLTTTSKCHLFSLGEGPWERGVQHGQPRSPLGQVLSIAAAEAGWHEQNETIAFKRSIVNLNIIVHRDYIINCIFLSQMLYKHYLINQI